MCLTHSKLCTVQCLYSNLISTILEKPQIIVMPQYYNQRISYFIHHLSATCSRIKEKNESKKGNKTNQKASHFPKSATLEAEVSTIANHSTKVRAAIQPGKDPSHLISAVCSVSVCPQATCHTHSVGLRLV